VALYPQGTLFTDSIFNDQIAQAAARQQLGQNRINEDETRSNYSYGLGKGGEANPFGQQQVLNRNQRIEGIDQKNQAASRPGGVRSGAFKVRQGNMVFNQAQQQDALQQNFQQAQLGYKRGREDVDAGYDTDVYNAGLGSVQRKLDADAAAGPQTPADTASSAASKGNTVANFTKTKTMKPFGFGKKPPKATLTFGKGKGVGKKV
jgi:hypothetical protein